MESCEVTALAELSDADLDMVAAGSHTSSASLVNINVPININLGVELANQTNVSLFSIAEQGGSQTLSLTAIGINL